MATGENDVSRKEKAHWMPWYIKDWLADTRELSLEVRGAYRELLDAQWMRTGLPGDHKTLQMLAGARDREWLRVWRVLEPFFPLGVDGLRRNAKLERVRRKHLNLAENGRLGATATNEEVPGKPPGEVVGQPVGKSPAKGSATTPASETEPETDIQPTTAAPVFLPPKRESPLGLASLVQRMQVEPERWQVSAFFDAMPDTEDREHWARLLVSCLDGLQLAQGKACTTSQLAAACTDYPTVVKSGKWGAQHFRACVQRIVDAETRVRDRGPPRSPADEANPFRAIADELKRDEGRKAS